MQGLKLSSLALGAPQAAGGGGGGSSGWADDFATAGALDSGWLVYDHYEENNPGQSAHDEIGQTGGRFRARIQNNAGNSGNGKSLVWRTGGNDYYGVIYYKVLTAPFDVALLDCRVASQGDPTSFLAAMVSGGEYAFIGLGARNPDDLASEYEHLVIGYRGGTETAEWKRRSGATSVSQGDVGAFASNEPVGSVRLAVDAGGNRTWYYSEDAVEPVSWTTLVTAWGGLAAPALMNVSNEVAVCISAYAFDNFVPDAGYYASEAVLI